ncbi:DNA double-strand break repair nuclease NurA [Halococcus dombrowskii]|uniref:DNA double-strand break repair nuclease NurA n=1 Tax=Halococcus dombrowskii TaxID=179637 RepID=A0AAV3SCF4_HALDO|nr:DNA double-strand break repair nuclease NurA [Halococcus dombrowskii]UOO94288.1 DNA double-strand break repair nuclease NurA [Halococcus dombrowskii]
MPFYPVEVANELQDYVKEIREYTDDERIVAKYRDAFDDALAEYDADRLRERFDTNAYPGALPTADWDEHDRPVDPFDISASWENHEAINRFAKDILEGVTTIAADGSELGPTTEFTVPLGLVQVAWTANHHDPDGDYDGDVGPRILGPDAVTESSDDGNGVRYPDEQAPSHERYYDEGKTVVECIKKFADYEPTPVIVYDGALVPSFADTYAPDVRESYHETMAEVLAVSEHHEVPVVGYVAGTKRKNIAKMLQQTYPELLSDEPTVADARILDGFTENWGDRSLVFVNRWDSTVDELEYVYEDTEYGFDEEVLFTYLDVPGGDAMDYLEFPEWIQDADLVEHVLDVVRAETGVGRGYPEILQQADANAVLDTGAKERFLALVQEFADEEDLPIDWDAKTLSKERRRR